MAKNSDPYSNSRRTEPSMRDELNYTFDGKYPEIAKSHKAVLRRMRRTSSNELIPCECVDTYTKEPDVDKFCPFCWGEGNKWDEVWIDIYKIIIRSDVGLAGKEDLIAPGLMNIPLVIFYVRSSVVITEQDKLVEVILNSEGGIESPVKRRYLYRIGTAVDYRSDNGRLEYWKLDCYAEKRKFLNGK